MTPIAKLLLAFYLDPPLIKSQGSLPKEKMISIGYSQLVIDIHCFVLYFNFFEDYVVTLFIANLLYIHLYSNISIEEKSLLFYYFVCLEYHSDIIFQYRFFDANFLNTNSLITFFQALDYTAEDEELFEWRRYIF